MKRTRSGASWWAGFAALALLATPGTGASAAEGAEEAPPYCYDVEWKLPCRTTVDCTPDDPYDDAPCDFVLPRECAEVEKIDCGDMPNRVQLDVCLVSHRLCSRAKQLGEGSPIAPFEYVDDFDFASGPLEALPGDLVCQGLLSPETDRWCSYVETVYPDASFLETSVWLARHWMTGDVGPEPFARIGAEAHPECRMHEGQLLGRVEVDAAGFRCPEGAPLPDVRAESLRLSDVAFSNTNDDAYLDAVMTVAWRGGGSGSTTMTATLTRLEADGPLLDVRQLGPGFDCAKAGTPVEKLLCGDPRLGVLDGRLSRLYAHLRQPTKREDDAARRALLRDEQRRFLSERDTVCAAPDRAPCAALYRARIAELQGLAERDRCLLSDVACD